MDQLLTYISAALDILVQLAIAAILGAIFYTLVIAVRSMASNRAARWDLIAYIAVMLLMALVLFTYYPKEAIKAVRVGAERARPEAVLLREELRQWQPEWQMGTPAPEDTLSPDTPMPTVPPTPTFTIFTVESATPMAWPTSSPSSTPQPQPTATPCVVHLSSGASFLCPPTPQVTR